MLFQPAKLTEQEAWELVSKACRNGLYGYKKEFEKLPPEVQRTIRSPDQIRAWAKLDEDTFQGVVASNFMRSFRIQQARDNEFDLLPDEVKKRIRGSDGAMKLMGGSEDASSL